jgi:adenosylcobinamide-GDP ribazoletransferase
MPDRVIGGARIAGRASRPFLAAISFLTLVPVGRRLELDAAAVARAAPLYPLVGAALGAAGGAAAGWLPVLGVAVVAVLSGAMHLDGLADTADALGGRTRERRLEIMRDHAIGAYGATALALALLLKVGVLAELDEPFLAYLAAGACSRWAPLPLVSALPYARSEGQARALTAARPWAATLLGLLVAGAIAVAAAGLRGLGAVAAAAAVALLLGLFFRRWLGGVTGDTLGATVELAEIAALAALL